MNFECKMCIKNMKNKKGLVSHLKNRKTSCIKNKNEWCENKKYLLECAISGENPDCYRNRENLSFNDRQLQFINSPLGDLKLFGIPGGGKTRSIIEKIKHHINKCEFKNGHDFIILTFSKCAQNDFIEKGKKVIQNTFTNLNVRTFHSLAGAIVNKLLKRNTGSIETLILSAYHVLKKNNIDDILTVKSLTNIKCIFVDEAQDISKIQYDFLILLKNILKCHMIMVGDPNQNIYQFQGSSDKYLINYKAPTIHLKINYRSTQNIVSLINKFRPHDNFEHMISGKKTDTNDKVVFYVNDVENIINDILAELKNTKYKFEDIAIIGPVKKSNKRDSYYTNIGLSVIRSCFEENKINYVQHYSDTGDKSDCITKKERTIGSINLLTMHGSKGLEFKKVFLLNFHFKTMGRKPTLEQYNEFKYLWYVGLSRAEYEMKIYIDIEKKIWPSYNIIDSCDDFYNICNNSNKTIKYNKNINFKKEESKKIIFSVTKILEDMKIENLYEFEKYVKFEVEKTQLYDTDYTNILEYEKYSCVYGLFIELVFEYYYYTENKKTPLMFSRIKTEIENIISVPKKYKNGCTTLKQRFSIMSETFTLNSIIDYKNKFSKNETKLFDYLIRCVENDLDKKISIEIDNKLIKSDNKHIIEICDTMLDHNYHNDHLCYIFKIALYNFQKQTESAYLWERDFSEHIISLGGIIENIKNIVKSDRFTELSFQITNNHPNLPIFGIADVLRNNTDIIDIKFTKKLKSKHVFQTLLYYNNFFPNWKEKKELYILNLYQGVEYKITISNDVNNYEILKMLCDTTDTLMKNNIFLYDLETTGLDTNTCEITDRYFEEYNLGFSPSSGLLKIEGELTPFISNLTNITNEMLEKDGDDFKTFESEMETIFKYCDCPKFMAHNGSNFDHKILKNNDILQENCAHELLDSRFIIRMLYQKTDTRCLKLEKIYKTILPIDLQKEYISHRAEADVYMMIDILKHLEYRCDDNLIL